MWRYQDNSQHAVPPSRSSAPSSSDSEDCVARCAEIAPRFAVPPAAPHRYRVALRALEVSSAVVYAPVRLRPLPGQSDREVGPEMLASGVRHASTMAAVLASLHGASVGRAKGSVVLLHIPGDVAQLPDQPSGQMVAGARLMLLPGLSVLADVRWATRVDGSDHSHDGAAAVPLPAKRARVAPSSGQPFGWFVGWLKLNTIESRLGANLAASRCGESDGGVDGGRMGGGGDGSGGLGGGGKGGGERGDVHSGQPSHS